MGQEVRIKLMGSFTISTDGRSVDSLPAKSKKGAALMELLILQKGRSLPIYRIIHELNGERHNGNPENALKTLVSRIRALLNGISPGLGNSIGSTPGAYCWTNPPNVWVDVLELTELTEKVKKDLPPDERKHTFRRIMALYEGDLFHGADFLSCSIHLSYLHREYLDAVYAYIELLKAEESYNEICQVCRRALEIAEMDERLRLELMRAMVRLNRVSDAMKEYKLAARRSQKMLDCDLSDEMKASFLQMVESKQNLHFNLDSIRNELLETDDGALGPYFCDYPSFRFIYNLQIRNLERFGSTIFLGVIMISCQDRQMSSVLRESVMAGLTEILRSNLRRGDIVTRFSPNIMAMLLPTVNYETGGLVMERIKHLFYQEFPNKGVGLSYRLSSLGEGAAQFTDQPEKIQKGDAE